MQARERILQLAARLAQGQVASQPEARLTMAPSALHGRMQPGRGAPSRQAAVLMLLRIHEDGIRLPLIMRNRFDADVHGGQIALPGGSLEGDEGPVEAAVRESWEEIGIEPESIVLFGSLRPHYIPVSNYTVTPVVGWVESPPVYTPDGNEVARVFEQSLEELVGPELRSSFLKQTPLGALEFPCWNLQEGRLWGATAMLLSELLALLYSDSPTPAAPPSD